VSKPNDRVHQATHLARDVAPDLDTVLITHFPDVETLDTFRPGETDLATALAVNRAVAEEMHDAGVEILVQRADKAAYRRWMATREEGDSWIDRGRLLKGNAAWAALGVKAPAAPEREVFGKAPGPIADGLLEAFADEESGAFDGLVQDLLSAGRIDVLDLAVRKLGEREGDEAGDDLNWVLLVAAEGASVGPSGWAELVVLPVALPAGDLPDGEALVASLIASGALAESEDVRLLPGWRSQESLAALSFAAVRRVLLDMVDGKPPQDLPPGDTDDLARSGFGVLLGLRIDWDIPVWDEIAARGGLPDAIDDEAVPTPGEARREALFDQWRGRVFQEGQGCVPLGLVAFSQAANEIAEFIAEAGAQTGGLEEIREFIGKCRSEAGGDEVLCHLHIASEELGLSVYTQAGRFIECLVMPAERLPARVEDMPPLIGAFVTLVLEKPV